MKRTTLIIEGALAFHTARASAATQKAQGLQIMTLAQVAARLAGGYSREASSEELDAAIQIALATGGFRELEAMRKLPGMTRAVSRTLRKLWQADRPLADLAASSDRLADLAEIETRVREALPAGAKTLPDLRDLALARVAHAPAVLGQVEMHIRGDVAPLWRTLVNAISERTALVWRHPRPSPNWFSGTFEEEAVSRAAAPERVSCANPRAETVEALRWARELIASGNAQPGAIAIVAAEPSAWDGPMQLLARDAALPLYAPHGQPALTSYEGQGCAALADILAGGLSQKRVRRLFAHIGGRSLADLPQNWDLGIERDAALFSLDHWRLALDAAVVKRGDGIDPRPVVLPVLLLLSEGFAAAERAGSQLLMGAASALWEEALRRAPAEAIEFTLGELRIPDDTDPARAIVWCAAQHLVEAPRPFVRLLGLTARSWPRRGAEDPLLPRRLLAESGDDLGRLDPAWVTQEDRNRFRMIVAGASGACVLSRARRDAQGKLLTPSPLMAGGVETLLRLTRVPAHAFSESDRLLARPRDAAKEAFVASATACALNRRSRAATAHDGLIDADHPLVVRAFDKPQSATSLRRLLRDPLGFVWRYALGWSAPADDDEPLEIRNDARGELVHELLRHAVDALEPEPGYVRANETDLENALASARRKVAEHWPLERPVPPRMLWEHTLDAAVKLAFAALRFDSWAVSDSRSWTETAFGQTDGGLNRDNQPWPSDSTVTLPGSTICVQGRVDRLDLSGTGTGVRVTDYKTGSPPKDTKELTLDGGRELQRVIYGAVARSLLPEAQQVHARLIYLRADQPEPFVLQTRDLDTALTAAVGYMEIARASLLRGVALPGPDAAENWNDFRIALPVQRALYLLAKSAAFRGQFGEAAKVWTAP